MKIIGLNNVLKRLQFDESDLEGIMNDVGNDVLSNTKSIIGAKDSTVSSSYDMYVTKDEQGWVINVGSNIELSAYYEWGTGDFVVVPPETTDAYTMSWFKTGKGTLRPYPALIPSARTGVVQLVDKLNEYYVSLYK